MAHLLLDVLLHYRAAKKYQLHEFVIMPNHLHLLFSVEQGISVERAVQLIKGGFSYRAARELDFRWPVWHRSFSEIRIYGKEPYNARMQYIHENPIRAGLVQSASEWMFSSIHKSLLLDPSPFGG